MKKYIPFFKAGMMEELAYKAVVFFWVIITVLQLACVVFLWFAVYQNSETGILNGFTYQQMIVYFVYSNIFAFSCMDSPTLHTINDEIKDGTIAVSFIRPISYRIRFIATSLGCCLTRLLVFGIPGFVIAHVIFGLLGYIQIASVGEFLLHILLFFVCTVSAIVLLDSINYICGIMCFYTTAAWGMNQAKNVLVSFFSGMLIPISFFPGFFGKVVEILPFAGLAQNPVFILMQTADIQTSLMYCLRNLLWIIVFEIIGKLLFMHASKKVTVQGG